VSSRARTTLKFTDRPDHRKHSRCLACDSLRAARRIVTSARG